MTSELRAHPRPRRRPRPYRASAVATALAATALAALATAPAPAQATVPTRTTTVAQAATPAPAVAARAVATRGAASGAVTAAATDAPSGGFEQRVLFKAAREKGYVCFRIPAVVRTVRGTLLAFAEGRVHDCGDAGDIDLVVKRSTDGGRTWGPLQVVNRGGGDTHGNPAPVVDRRTGRILLAETYNKGRADGLGCDTPCDRTPHLQYSDDDGATWSAPRDLTRSLRPRQWNSWYATGPVHGIQLTRGRHAGRLLLGVNGESYAGHRVTANHAALVLSDDGGNTWRVGARDTWPVTGGTAPPAHPPHGGAGPQPAGAFRQKPSEMTLLERSDGSVYVNGREQDGTDLGNRTAAVSRDGGDSFTAPFRAIPDLYAPMVQASALRLPHSSAAGGGSRTLLAAPADPDRRRAMTLRSSYDEGRTWEGVERGARVTADRSGYSDLVAVSPTVTGLLYEGGRADARDEIRFARFTEEWLGPRRGPDPTTPDLAPGARPAAVLGGARLTGGPFGRALAFDGADDAVRLPFRDTLPLGSRDFTALLWFRYRAATGEQPLLWMGGVGSTAPQVAVVGDPAHGRLTARLTAVDGARPPATARVAAGRPYNDGAWHHLALRRTGGRLTLTVDGAAAASVADVPGTVSRTSAFGVHLGQRPDGRAQFTGALAQVRVYRRALTDAELARIRGANTTVPGPLVLALPLDRVSGGR
ncbi:exo-alpha-sialidase [Streptomyces sp. RS10V-4]|uniref:sialidase family protein n=1 Tax=Streptomyces rhizoryzae TaxID=2932493 RepID=UPI00200552FB|nr:sialidase family protein [Streptomyces rhizoryzae]MCK7622869.1 exo-alpha-sialidase [Streptomyces rhizoryzae]